MKRLLKCGLLVIGLLCGSLYSEARAQMPAAPKRILIVLTSHADLYGTGKKTGFWFEELAVPYFAFQDAGHQVTLASPRGGKAPADPRSEDRSIPAVARFLDDAEAMHVLANTVPLARVKPELFDAIFLAGGHGTLWDFVDNPALDQVIDHFVKTDKVIAAVCHGPAGLLAARTAQGTPLVKGREVTAFTTSEEKAVKLDQVVPLYIEAQLRQQGAQFMRADDFRPMAVRDGMLITGQNPASSQKVAQYVLEVLKKRPAPRM